MLSFSDFTKIFAAYEQYVAQQAQPMAQPMAQPQAQPQAIAPVAQSPTPPISMTEYVQRLEALEQRAPMPTMDTPKPATVDDIILGIIGAPKQRGAENNVK